MLTDVELGRAVRHLVFPYGQRTKWSYSQHEYVDVGPSRSWKEVGELLHISGKQAREAHDIYREAIRVPSFREEAALLAKFLRAHNRWPRKHEFQRRKGLPSRWRWDGYDVRILDELVKHHKLRPGWIIGIPNLTIRRQAIEKYGYEYIVRGGTPSQQNDWGTLWRLERPGEEDVVLVEVVNATAEPDGSFAHYFLRVPPDTTTAKDAVAWTFSEDERGRGELVIKAAS